jgi:hypothetical protein
MPHVKLTGELDPASLWKRPPAYHFSVPEEELHVKFSESFLNHEGNVLLLKYIVVEGRLTQRVQVLIVRTGSEWLVKLDGTYPVLRSAGVKLLLATIGAWLASQGLQRVASNLGPYEARGAFYALHMSSESENALEE